MQEEQSAQLDTTVQNEPTPQGPVIADVMHGLPSLEQSSEIDATSQPAPVVPDQAHDPPTYIRFIFIGVAALLIVGVGVFTFLNRGSRDTQLRAGSFKTTAIQLTQLSTAKQQLSGATTLQVNGQLRVQDSLILNAIVQPKAPLTGQLFFDKDAKQLSFYNGQQFVSLGAGQGDTNVTNLFNVTNVLSGSGAGVQLQTNSPGIQQAGNFNISGVGKVGSLKTTVIDSSGGTLYVNPAGATSQQLLPPGTPANTGLTTIGSTMSGTGWANDLSGTKVTLGTQGGVANSITIYFGGGSGSGHFQVGLYSDDGDIPSKPADLLATSSVTNLTPNSFNTATIPAVTLSANNTYWLVVNSDDTTATRPYNGGNKATCFRSSTFGFMPNPFSTSGCFVDDNVYTIYLNYTLGTGSSDSFSQAQFVLGNTGQALFQNTTDSNTAFQIQNASGTNAIFNVDTINGRIGIGKTTPSYKLDVAAGDINLSNGHSLRFGGVQALSSNGSGTTISLTNFIGGGTVSAQADNFLVQDANATHQSLAINNIGAATFSNRTDGTTAFQVQNATGTPLLRADTTGMKIFIGNPLGSASPVLLYLANKNTADDPIGGEGATYYNSTLGSFRCFYSGFWHNCADIEPQHNFSLYDEFISGQTSFTGTIGGLGWNAVAIGANGSLALNPGTPTPSADRPGVLRLQTPASTNQGTTLLLGDSSGGSMMIAKDNNIKAAVAPGAASGQIVRIGLHNETSATTQPTSGVWWEADPSTSLNWRYCYGNGTTATCASTAVAVTANIWVTLEIRITATGNGTSAAYFIINNTAFQVTAITIDTTNRVSPALTCFATTGSAQNCYYDYFQLTGTTSIAR